MNMFIRQLEKLKICTDRVTLKTFNCPIKNFCMPELEAHTPISLF